MTDVDQLIAIRQTLSRIWEADEMPSAPPSDAAEPAPPEEPAIDQPKLDKDIDDVMTTPRVVSADDDSIEGVANDLGVDDTAEFTASFDALRSGSTSDSYNTDPIVQAFYRLMSADTSTVQKSINRLRDIYNKPIGA